MRKYANVDLVFLANPMGDINILPPQSDKTARVHKLSTSYSKSLSGDEVDSLMTSTEEQRKLLNNGVQCDRKEQSSVKWRTGNIQFCC